MTEPYRNLPLLLLKTREQFMVHFRPILKENNLTEQQWRVLQILHEFGDMEPKALCEHCCILSPSMAGILKRMEDVDLIIKAPMADQRRVMISLSAEAEKIIMLVQGQVKEKYESIEKKLDEKMIHNLYRVLDTLIERV